MVVLSAYSLFTAILVGGPFLPVRDRLSIEPNQFTSAEIDGIEQGVTLFERMDAGRCEPRLPLDLFELRILTRKSAIKLSESWGDLPADCTSLGCAFTARRTSKEGQRVYTILIIDEDHSVAEIAARVAASLGHELWGNASYELQNLSAPKRLNRDRIEHEIRAHTHGVEFLTGLISSIQQSTDAEKQTDLLTALQHELQTEQTNLKRWATLLARSRQLTGVRQK